MRIAHMYARLHVCMYVCIFVAVKVENNATNESGINQYRMSRNARVGLINTRCGKGRRAGHFCGDF